ncbi:MAG: VanZ family protein [Cephaloticoccus sp.]|nr:VanZ family protein [Cephaloticoccus sp.]
MSPATRPNLLPWAYVAALAATIVFASGRSVVVAPDIVDFDKLAHFFIYGLLATLVTRAGFPERRGWWAVLIVSLFGLTDEWHQSFTPGRAVELADWVADTLGAITAVAVYMHWRNYRTWLENPLWTGKARVENRPEVVPNLP